MNEMNLDLISDKLISPEAAAQKVKSGDLVVIPTGREPSGICYALAARKNELKDVKIYPGLAGHDFGWYDEGWEDSFKIEAGYVMPILVEGMGRGRFEYIVPDVLLNSYFDIDRHIDILLMTLSYPDIHGYCTFGGSVWLKKEQINYSKLVIAELTPHQIRTYGNNFVNISEIDYFTQHVSLGAAPKTRDMLGRTVSGPSAIEKKISDYVSTLIKDGDTIQIGAGGTTEFLPQLGAFEGKNDLGIHSEIIPGGIIDLVKKGNFTGAQKTLHKGKAVGTAIGGGRKHYDIVNGNPAFELYSSSYTNNPKIIAKNNNMVAINSAFAVDIYGQIFADSLGFTMLAGVGGQLGFAIGAFMSEGGRYIVVIPSTTSDGKSRIVFTPQPGTVISVSRNLSDYIVTEYGIAALRGKSQRKRAEAIISIAHPNFRSELKQKVKEAFIP